jgi:hypothetical protein
MLKAASAAEFHHPSGPIHSDQAKELNDAPT